MTQQLVIWGASGHSRVVADAARVRGDVKILGFLDDDVRRKGEAFAGSTILGGREVLGELSKGGACFIHVAIGHCAARLSLGKIAMDHGLALRTIVHPAAVVAMNATLGAGTFLAAGAVVNPEARIGQSVIVNTGASVDHECTIDDGVHIGPGAHLGGLASVGRGTWIGIGATLLHGVRVGEGSIVGAGAVVLRDLPSGIVAYGIPARVIREKRSNEQ